MSVLIEFTKNTEKRARGERVRVDEVSARSFVEKKRVAKRITEKDLETPPVEDDTADERGDESPAQDDTPAPAGGVS